MLRLLQIFLGVFILRVQIMKTKTNSKSQSRLLSHASQSGLKRRPLARAMAVALSLSVAQSQAATINVTNESEIANPGCHLRDAIAAANSDSPVGACSAGSGADVIDLSAIAGKTLFPSLGEFAVNSNIQLNGHGVTIHFQNQARVFNVSGGHLDVKLLSIKSGKATDGGAVLVRNGASFTLRQSSISGSSADNGAGIYVASGSEANIIDSLIYQNTAGYGGGGINVVQGTLTMVNSTLSGNSAQFGGGISADGVVSLLHTTLQDNRGGVAAGIEVRRDGILRLTNSIISGSSSDDCKRTFTDNYGAYVYTYGVNLIAGGGAACSLGSSATLLTGSAGLGALSDNGGPTLTHLPLPDSPVLQAGADKLAPAGDDQRGTGFDRIAGHAVDLGAVELQQNIPQAGPNFIVTSTDDVDDGVCESGLFHCSLREAINAANDLAYQAIVDTTTITFHSEVFPATITLAGSELPRIQRDLIIEGLDTVIDANHNSRHFTINERHSLSLSHMTLQNGVGGRGRFGGAIDVKAGSKLTLDHVTLSGNSSELGGALFVSYSAIATISNSTFSGNSASSQAGAIWLFPGSVTLINSTLSGNSSARSGAIYTNFGHITLINSTVSGNSSLQGGAIGVNAKESRPGTLSMTNSIIANSLEGVDCEVNSFATLQLFGQNLIEDGSCNLGSINLSGDPRLGPLANNGGSTQTHLPLRGSPVIDAGVNGSNNEYVPGAYDQRGPGFPRVIDQTLDIGALEYFEVLIFKDGLEDPP